MRRLRRPGSSMRSTPCGEKEGEGHPSEAPLPPAGVLCEGWLQPVVWPQRQGRLWDWGLQLSPPAALCTGTSEETLFSAHTPDLSGPARYPKNCLQEPCGHHMHTHRASGPEGWLSGGPHLGLLRTRGAEAKAVKPKKLLRRLRGCLGCIPSFRQLRENEPQKCWARPPRPSGFSMWPSRGRDRCCHQDGPASTSSGGYLHKCTRIPCTWLLPRLWATQLSPGQRLPAL